MAQYPAPGGIRVSSTAERTVQTACPEEWEESRHPSGKTGRRRDATFEQPKLLHPEAASGADGADLSGRSAYADMLQHDERSIFERVRHERGLEHEIALLRLHICLLLQDSENRTSPATIGLITRAIDLLIKALRAQGIGVDAEHSALERELERAAAEIQQRGRES